MTAKVKSKENKNRSLSNIKKLTNKILNDLHKLEDLTNYDIKNIGKCIDIMQEINIDAEYKKYNT